MKEGENPLLVPVAAATPSSGGGEGLPRYDAIRPEHAEPAIDRILADNRAALERLLETRDASGDAASWDALIEPLCDIEERLSRAWGPVSHLFGVSATAEWRAAYGACLPKVTQYQIDLSQDARLYRAYEGLATGGALDDLSEARKKIVRDALRDFRLSGVALEGEPRARFGAIVRRLSELGAKFQENVIDSVKAWHKHVTDEGRLVGMTVHGKALARDRAQATGLEGFLLTIDLPGYDAVARYADDRDLRREVYEAFATRASDRGPLAGRFDNGPLVEETLALRYELARLLGYRNYAEVSLETKMAESPEEAEAFLLDLNRRVRPRALAELEDMRAFAAERDGIGELHPWDVAYYAEKLKTRRLGFSDDDIRPYFALDRVVRGMFSLVMRLYGLRIEQDRSVATWHPDVTTYRLRSEDGAYVGMFYLDPFARRDKREGAWMDECVVRRRTKSALQHPAAYLVCNFAPPLEGKPSLLTHREVVTLFHEFGHGLHHLLTKVDDFAASGIRGVEGDAVELPSQFMENWCYDGPTLASFARHVETGEPLPAALLEKLRAERSFQAGLATVRQLEFGLFDLRIHRSEPLSGARVLEVLAEARREVSVLPPPEWNRLPSSFSHIFAGGYAAGYYGYKWAEVLSADAFAAFEETSFAPDTGRRFRDAILARGGSQPAMSLYVAFRGRKPTIDALLRHSGLS
jgi:oligopeptidase A